METMEPLCDLKMIRADYRSIGGTGPGVGHVFRIRLAAGRKEVQFDVPEVEGELFAAELEALAAIMKSRVIRARLIGEEST